MKNIQGEVWVFAEQEDGKVSEVPFELLGKARELADRLGVKVGAALLGDWSGDAGKAALASAETALFEGGADIVHLVDDPELKVFRNKAYRHAMVELVKEANPQIVIFGATHMGRDIAPSVASALRCGLTADCTDLQIGDHLDKRCACAGEEPKLVKDVLLQIRPAFGGNIIATIVNPYNWPQMATVRDATVNLKGSRIIVTGGAGVGSKENFALLHELAAVLGGAVGGSRAAVDLGYCEHERQIGQTGVTVRPALMISCGVSGAVQHLAGMKDSAKIIAINTDRDAPIFKVAHYGIVGDLNVVIPKLIKAVKNKG